MHWEDRGRGVHTLHETYEGMDSDDEPCSGFATVDDEGVPCAGFRQCGSNKGTTGLNPKAQKWDVPMEVRCAKNSNLTEWGAPEFIYDAYFYRALPYDPVRPWKDTDGKWYSAWSTDGCNGTNQWGPTPADNLKKLPCKPGGQLELLVSDALHGSKANWKQLPPMFTTNTTKSGALTQSGVITGEFVTSGYFGGLSGDPDGGKTRVVTQNRAGTHLSPCILFHYSARLANSTHRRHRSDVLGWHADSWWTVRGHVGQGRGGGPLRLWHADDGSYPWI